MLPAHRGRLLQAVAAGIPVIASEACGLSGVPGVTEIPAGNAQALTTALASLAPSASRSIEAC